MIYIISSGLDTVTEQLTDSTLREYVVDRLILEMDYTIAVRGYYQLLGPAGTTTVRLEGIIDNTWLTVEPDTIACNCIIHDNRSYHGKTWSLCCIGHVHVPCFMRVKALLAY